MKKNLITLTVAISATVSGSAMAWTPNGLGGSVELGGTLTPAAIVTPWEVYVGAAVNNLNANIKKGRSFADVAVSQAIPILGIRTINNKAFAGAEDCTPIIDYSGAVNLDGFVNGVTTLTLDIKDSSGKKIGTMTAPFSAAGVISWKNESNNGRATGLWAADGSMFYGGLAKSQEKSSSQSELLAKSIISDIADHFDSQGYDISGASWSGTPMPGATYSGYYAGGITAGSSIKITLDTAVTGDDSINWKASLPVTVSYQ